MSLPFSEYQTDNQNNKKRQSTIGKPNTAVKTKLVGNDLHNQLPSTFEDAENEKLKRMNRVNELLNIKTYEGMNNEDDQGMGNFEPIPGPTFNKKPEYDDNKNPELLKYSPMLSTELETNAVEQPRYGNYRQIYEKPMTALPSRDKPYYAQMGISGQGTTGSREMDKIWEKLNYMTLLLEEQKNEKTDYVAEEFLLYTFLGVFVIYVVDSFSRSGKYIR